MSDYSSAALKLFKERAISPEVAASAHVKEEDGCLVYPTGKCRSLDGKHLQPTGEEHRPWWIPKQPTTAPQALITEGETDGLAAASHLDGPFEDLPVLALPGASYPAHKLSRGFMRYSTQQAFLCLDADEAGRKALRRYSDALRHAVRPIPVELPDGYDLAAWLAEGNDLAHLLADAEAADETRRRGRSFAEIEADAVEWLWPGWVPFGHITVLGGDPKAGKSTLSMKFAARASRDGRAVLGAWTEDPPGIVRSRLETYGAQLSLVRELTEDDLLLPGNVERLREQVILNDARFVILDHFDAFLNEEINPTRKNEAKRALAPLQALAREFNIAIMILCHLNRYTEGPRTYKIPAGLAGSARSLLMLTREEGGAKLEHLAGNYAANQGSINYKVNGGTLQGTASNPPPRSREAREGNALVWTYDDER